MAFSLSLPFSSFFSSLPLCIVFQKIFPIISGIKSYAAIRGRNRQLFNISGVMMKVSIKMSILSQLHLSPCLRSRINDDTAIAVAAKKDGDDLSIGFVLYLPTVNLRLEHNPAFAVACHAANHLKLPLVVLAVVCDDASHRTSSPACSGGGVVMTARRLAFTLQALSHACNQWSRHGAAVGVRVHGPNGARVPDHLTLASNASFVVTDESFVSPYTTITRRVKEACRKSKVPCVSVDGSTTVPPIQVLRRSRNPVSGEIVCEGIPQKAYLWQNKTEHLRDAHLKAAMQGEFCAPPLQIKLEDDDLFHSISGNKGSCILTLAEKLAHLFPRRWKPTSSATDSENQAHSLPSCPDVRPFTSGELSALFRNDDCYKNDEAIAWVAVAAAIDQSKVRNEESSRVPFYNFSMQWADRSVPPCEHTIGTYSCGIKRWNAFVQKGGLLRYGKERNNAKLVHSVSRMSSYLNLGVVSIYRLVSEAKRAKRQAQGKSSQENIDKFLQEIIKFRELSYAHAFSRGNDYDGVGSLPRWSVQTLNEQPRNAMHNITLEELATGRANDSKWNAMQQYLVRTGELHNNVRMTWGKTVVSWASSLECDNNQQRADVVLKTLCYLNDRFALDGLSPPSYAGILWCMGWMDKPTNVGECRIPMKHAYRYRMSPEEFLEVEKCLLSAGSSKQGGNNKQQGSVLDMMKMQSRRSSSDTATVDYAVSSSSNNSSKGMKRNGSIDAFFSKPAKKKPSPSRIIG